MPADAHRDTAATVVRWRIIVRSLDPMDPDSHEIVEVSDENGDMVFTHEAGITIRTSWTPVGSWREERIVPWAQVLDYRQERS